MTDPTTAPTTQTAGLDTLEEDVNQLERAENTSTDSTAMRGTASVSGSDPDPSSDDDVLQNAHQVGIAPDADIDNPTELDIAKDVEEAEEYHKHH